MSTAPNAANARLVSHLRVRLAQIGPRAADMVAKMSDEEILSRYAEHTDQKRQPAND
jgi:hypothetical protein